MDHMTRIGILWLCGAVAAVAQEPTFDGAFWKVWGDGQAELAGYDLTQPRYGAPRRGTAVTIFVSETFSNSARVKADPGKHPPADQYPVMKLNLVKDYQTGIYDYNDMTSAFVALQGVNGHGGGALTKVSFSGQEWCGHVWQQLLFDQRAIRAIGHSYFDGEADQSREIAPRADGIGEDALFHWARGMAAPVLKPGQSQRIALLMALSRSRASHTAVDWQTATLRRSTGSKKLTVPAGTFEVETLSVDFDGGLKKTFLVETSGSRRIIQWETSEGEAAKLLGSGRMKYWEMNRPGGEAALKQLGLAPRPPRTT
jgi:hypothetical protein